MVRSIVVTCVVLFAGCTPAGSAFPNVTVLALGRALDGGAESGLPVIINNANGEISETTRTDALGKALVYVPPGGTVTIARPSRDPYYPPALPFLLTWTAVEDGDVLRSGDVSPFHAPPRTGTWPQLSVTLPEPVVGADSYRISIGCSTPTGWVALASHHWLSAYPDGGTPPEISFSPTCRDVIDVLAVASVAGASLAFASAEDVPMSAPTTDVVLPAWSTDFASVDVAVTNPRESSVSVFAIVRGNHRGGGSPAHAYEYAAGVSTRIEPHDAGTLVLRYPAPMTRVSASFHFSPVPGIDLGSLTVQWGSPPVSSLAISTVGPATMAQHDATAGPLVWQLEPTNGVDAQVVTGVFDSYSEWRAVVPPGATSVTVPTLPLEFRAATSSWDVCRPASVMEVHSSEWTGYADARREIFVEPWDHAFDVTTAETPTSVACE